MSRVLGIFLISFLTLACPFAQVQPQAPEPAGRADMTEEQVVRDSTQSFLTAWLVDQDLARATAWFSEAAFQNEAILQEPCSGYVKSEERGSEPARRAGVKKFLLDFLPGQRVKTLGQILNPGTISEVGDQLAGKLVNNPKTDLFALAKLTKQGIPATDVKDADYLRAKLPERFYASFVPVGGGLVYFLWIPDPKGWRIYHASLVCM
jgi:hypothetical protein